MMVAPSSSNCLGADHGLLGIDVEPAIGERIGSDIHDAHDQSASSLAQGRESRCSTEKSRACAAILVERPCRVARPGCESISARGSAAGRGTRGSPTTISSRNGTSHFPGATIQLNASPTISCPPRCSSSCPVRHPAAGRAGQAAARSHRRGAQRPRSRAGFLGNRSRFPALDERQDAVFCKTQTSSSRRPRIPSSSPPLRR